MTKTNTTTPTHAQYPLEDLPPDPEGMNDRRASWAEHALVAFKGKTGSDDGDALCDLLCDLMHLSDRDASLGYFDRQLERARAHYRAEIGEEVA